jgi:hypothetical protein
MREAVMLAGLLMSLAGRGSAPAEEKGAGANAKARREAAEKVYEGLLARRRVDPTTSAPYERLHRWSLHWMEAQAETGTKKEHLAAAEAHLARMRDLEREAQELRKKRLIVPYEVFEAEFYRLDAEKRLRALGKK